jgi:hypothetical protein
VHEFLMLLSGLSEHARWPRWVKDRPVPVRGQAAVQALVDRL